MEGGSTFNEVHFIYYTPGPVGSPGPDLTLAFWPNTGGVDGDAWPAVIEPPSAAFSLPTLPGHDGHGSEPDNGSVWLATVSLPVTVDLGTSNIWMGLQAQNAVVGAGNAGYAFSDKDAAVGHTHDFFFQVPGFTQFGNPLDFYGSFAYGLSFIPEPSTAALLAIGLAGIGVRRHRARGEGGNHQYCSALAMHVAGD
jgi:hypothetical protein